VSWWPTPPVTYISQGDKEQHVSEKPPEQATEEKETAGKPQNAEQDKGYVDLEPDEEESAHVKGGSSRR
jgi:hypothetical protein